MLMSFTCLSSRAVQGYFWVRYHNVFKWVLKNVNRKGEPMEVITDMVDAL